MYFESSSVHSTESDTSSEREEDQLHSCKTNPLKHKTELCKNFSELGYCHYGKKCRFAHGRQELVSLSNQPSASKQKKCNGLWKHGVCLYGVRCQFAHAKADLEQQIVLTAGQIMTGVEPKGSSILMSLLGY